MIEPQVAGLFETSIVVDEMPDAVDLNRELRRVIADHKRTHEGRRVSNIGGWQSEPNMVDWGGNAAKKLSDRVIAAANQFTVDVKSTGTARFRWQPEMWANVSRAHASNQLHTHPGSFWSAVYYVDDGYGGSADAALGGELVFVDPRMPMIMMAMPTLRYVGPTGVKEPQLVVRPKSGRIIMFPGWLNHGVMPYEGTGERISIAINLAAEPLRRAS